MTRWNEAAEAEAFPVAITPAEDDELAAMLDWHISHGGLMRLSVHRLLWNDDNWTVTA